MQPTLLTLALYLGISTATPLQAAAADTPKAGWTDYFNLDHPRENAARNDNDCYVFCNVKRLRRDEECHDYMAAVYLEANGTATDVRCVTSLNGRLVDYKDAGQAHAITCDPCFRWALCAMYKGIEPKNCVEKDSKNPHREALYKIEHEEMAEEMKREEEEAKEWLDKNGKGQN